jgi:succinylglutamate desuccinylase
MQNAPSAVIGVGRADQFEQQAKEKYKWAGNSIVQAIEKFQSEASMTENLEINLSILKEIR